MSRLIIVSNRVALPGKAEAGGLAVALQEALNRQGGIWCGWSGNLSETPRRHERHFGDVGYVTLDMTRKDYKHFYLGFCNSLLWPLCHYRLGLTRYTHDMLESYERVNGFFADEVVKLARPGDTVWVHDYQMLTLGAHMRKRGLRERMGFFIHIPFPVPEVLMALTMHKELLESLCAYDLIGFQTETDLQAFLRCMTELCGARAVFRRKGMYEVQACGRRFTAGCFPIGIDTMDMARTAQWRETATQTVNLRKSLGGRSMLIGVDRLDYSKGLTARLEAYHLLLQKHPEHVNKLSYIQITPPSRSEVEEYRHIRKELEERAAHINGANAEIDWVPIRYINKSFSREMLAGFYRTARVGLVTPFRDGMNLVAKEYVASQDSLDPGVLVLSQFAGAAQELDAALLVNPYDTEATAGSIHRALTMPLEERKERYEAMMRVLKANTIHHWMENFLSCLIRKPEALELPPHILQPKSRVLPLLAKSGHA